MPQPGSSPHRQSRRSAFGVVAALLLTSCPEHGALGTVTGESIAAGPVRGLTAWVSTHFARGRRAGHDAPAKVLLAGRVGRSPSKDSAASLTRPGATDGSTKRSARRELGAAEPGATHELSNSEPVLIAIGRETWVYDLPRPGSRKIGYLRFGAMVARDRDPVGDEECPGGWYRIVPEGYVCNNGRSSTLDLEHPLASFARRRPDRFEGLPYAYGVPRGIAPLQFSRLPSEQELKGEGEWVSDARARADWLRWPAESAPAWLRTVPNAYGYPRQRGVLNLGRAKARSAFSLLGLYDADGRVFGLTTDLSLVLVERLRPIEPSRFHGLALEGGQTLPVAFVMAHNARLFQGDPSGGKLTPGRTLGHREAVAVTGRRLNALGSNWLETRSGDWLRDERLVVAETPEHWPAFATQGRSWLDVSISHQTLTAYEGTRPVYVTLVSTGAAGLADHKTTTATKRGTFAIHTKHVTVGMDGEKPGEEFDLKDVPYVQYFTEGYALHAAFWHDDFGRPRSHGCVNLAPIDARWLFHFTSPGVPQRWHGALSRRDGTIVEVHP